MTSPSESEMKSSDLEFITVGRIITTRGVSGKLKVKMETDFPRRFAPHSKVYIDRQPMTIHSAEWHHGKLTLKLDSIDSAEDAAKLRGKTVEVHRSQLHSLPEGQYYYFQLIGLEVRTTGGEPLGKIAEIMPTGSNDNYVVRGNKGEILIPAIDDVVKVIDLDRGQVIVEPIEGLLKLNQRAES